MNKKILILYDHFDPAYKAGGPIRSLVNLVKLMEREVDIRVLTTNQDHDGSILDVEVDTWIAYGEKAHVMYMAQEKRTYGIIKRSILKLNPDIVYINGMFSLPFVIYPLHILKNQKHIKIIMAPRGMLQQESLAQKPWKKKVYLGFLKLFYLKKHFRWHVTTEQEYDELIFILNKDLDTQLLGNLPSFSSNLSISAASKSIRPVFGTVALISPMKNIHLVLQALHDIEDQLVYHLYGPVKDEKYWQSCQDIITSLPSNIEFTYHGDIMPDKVPHIISYFDFYIQPSKSENFGHSIFEAFNQGVPVIISDQTPWKTLKEKKAGWDVDLQNPKALTKAIQEAMAMNEETYSQYQIGARRKAEAYMQSHDFVKLYKELFS